MELAIIIWANSSQTRRMGEVYTDGMGNNTMSMKVSSNQDEDMARVHSGGRTGLSTLAASVKEIRPGMGFFIGQEIRYNTKATGWMDCSMVKEHSTFQTGKNFRVSSNKTSFMDRAFYIRRKR